MRKKVIDIDSVKCHFFTTSSIKCKYCGHTIFPTKERFLCKHCGKWNYKDKKIEFKYKTKEEIIKKRRKENGNKFKCN